MGGRTARGNKDWSTKGRLAVAGRAHGGTVVFPEVASSFDAHHVRAGLSCTMIVTGLTWLGTRTDDYAATVALFRDVMSLEVKELTESFAWFQLPNGDQVEVFGREDPDHEFFTTGPVVGFEVTDLDQARRELEAAGVEFIGEIHGTPGGRWSHFRGPDGTVYEITGS